MGNIKSEQRLIDRNTDEYNYNIDAQVFSKDDMIIVPNSSTQQTIKYNKIYIIYQRNNGISRTFVLSIKIIDNNIFVYITNILNQSTILAHVIKISERMENNISYYLKYIQVSHDFTLLSLPENDNINIYNLTKLLNCNILEYVDNIGIDLKTNVISDTKSEFKHNDFNTQPYKCVLYKELYVIVYIDQNRYKRIIANDYKNKIIHDVNNLDLDVNNSALCFSTNGHFIVIYDGSKKQLFICNMDDINPKPYQVSLDIKFSIVINCINK